MIVLVQIDQDEYPAARHQHAANLFEGLALISVIVKRFYGENFVERVVGRGNALGRSPHVTDILDSSGGLLGAAQHLVGHINTGYLSYWNQPGQAARSPAGAAAQVEHAVGRPETHQ